MEDYKSMNNNKGLVSIIIPMYNAEEFSSAMIESIIAQTYTNWELIVVDDGSTDNSLNIIRSFEQKDKRIKLICRPSDVEKGAPSCRNIGIQESQGEFIIFFDADDYIAPYCLSQRVDFMVNHPKCDFAIFPMLAFKEKLFDSKNYIWGYKQESNIVKNFISGTIPFVVVTNIYKRSSIISKELYWDTNLKSLQDSGYNIMALEKECSYVFSNSKPDYFYRISGNDNSISKKINTEKHFVTRLYFYRKITALFQNNKKLLSALLILSNIHFKKLYLTSQKSYIKDYLSSSFFDKYIVLKYKLLLIYNIINLFNLKNPKICNWILLSITPIFELRQRLHYRSFYKRNQYLYKEVIKELY